MNCPNCGHQNIPGDNFCERCGNDLRAFSQAQSASQAVRYCSNCGTENSGGAQFCSGCGKSLSGSAPLPSPQVPQPQYQPQSPPTPQVVVINQEEEEQKKRRNRLLLPLFLLLLLACFCASFPYLSTGAAPGSREWIEYYAGIAGLSYQPEERESVIQGQVNPPVVIDNDNENRVASDNQPLNNQQADNIAQDSSIGGSCGYEITDVSINRLSVTALKAYNNGDQNPSVISFDLEYSGPWNEIMGDFYLEMGPPLVSGYDWIRSHCWMDSLNKIMCDGPGIYEKYAGVDYKVRNIEEFGLCLDCTDDCGYYFTLENPAFDPVAIGSDPEENASSGSSPADSSSDSSAGVELAGPPTISVSSATMCRKGPGKDYAGIGDLQPGEVAEIFGQYADGDYWVIENYGVGGECWLSGYYAEVKGKTDNLPYYEAPALPKQTITFNFQNLMNEKFVCELYIAPRQAPVTGAMIYSGHPFFHNLPNL